MNEQLENKISRAEMMLALGFTLNLVGKVYTKGEFSISHQQISLMKVEEWEQFIKNNS